MTDLVPADQIEGIVGAPRRNSQHLGRAVSAERTVYILHSRQCLESGDDLRTCPFSRALDRGIDLEVWAAWQDRPAQVLVRDGRLVPASLPKP